MDNIYFLNSMNNILKVQKWDFFSFLGSLNPNNDDGGNSKAPSKDDIPQYRPNSTDDAASATADRSGTI